LDGNKLHIQPLNNDQVGSYTVTLSVKYSDEVTIQREIDVKVTKSEFLTFAEELPNPHVIERSFLTPANSY